MGLRVLVDREDDMRVVGEADNGCQGFQAPRLVEQRLGERVVDDVGEERIVGVKRLRQWFSRR